MGVLADEYIRVRADTSYLGRDLKREGAKSGSTLGKGILGGLRSIAGPVAGVLAAMGVMSFLRDASEAARESWKIGKQTQAVLKSTGGAANVTQRDIEKLTAAISAKTGIDDEAVQSGANLLLTFTDVRNEVGKGNDIFDQATQMVQDMSVALGQDGKNSALQLGKALNDPIKGVGALRRVGVQFTDQQKEQIKTLVENGDKLGAQKIILGELSKEFGGSAAAQATWRDKAIVAFDDVKENVGNLLNKNLEPLAKWFVETGAPAIKDFFKKLGQNQELKDALKRLSDAVKGITDKDFVETLDLVAEKLPAIVRGMADAAEAVGEFYDAIVAVNGIIGKEARGGMFDEKGPLGGITTFLKNAWRGMTTSFIENHSAILADVSRFVSGLVGWFASLPGRIGGAISRMWAAVKGSFVRNHASILAGVSRWVSGVVRFATDMKAKLTSSVTVMWTAIRSRFTSAQSAVRSSWSNFWSSVRTTAQTIWNAVRANLSAVWSAIRSAWSSAQSAVRSSWSGFWSSVRTTASTAINSVRTNVTGVLGRIRDAFRTTVGNIRTIWAGVKSAVSAPIQWIRSNVYNKPLVPVWNKVASLVSGPKLSTYAQGGEIRGPRHGRDNVLGISRRGTATAMVEPGEWIAPRWMSALFPQLESIRKQGRSALRDVGDPKNLPGFQGGGLVGWAKGLASNVSSKVGSFKDWALGGLRAAAAKILDPVKGLIGKAMPSSGVGTTVGGIGKKLIDLILDKIKSSDAAAMPALGGPAGSAIASGGWASIYRVLRAAGARSFTTYAGHDQGASRSRDIWPPSQAVAEAARRLSSIWYVIYNRRIASVTYGMRWRPYTRSNPHTDHVHVTLKPGVKAAMGGMAPMGQGLMNGGLIKGGRGGVLAHIGEGKRDELVTPLPRNWQRGTHSPLDARLDRLIAVLEARGNEGLSLDLQVDVNTNEPRSVRLNKALQQVGGGVGLVG